jgi:hypothetical protein
MADAISDAFLHGEGVPVDLRDIETELTRLWGPAAEQVGGPDLDRPSVTRVVLANLIVSAWDPSSSRVDETLNDLVPRYPSRVIVLRRSDAPERRIAAEVAAVCHLPAPGRPQVCSERIVLRAGPAALDLLPGAIRSLLEADLPTILWWTDDPRTSAPLFQDLAADATRLLLDLPDPEADPASLRFALDPEAYPHARDISWFAITRWRELVAQLFDPPTPGETLTRIDSVQIRARAPSRARPARVACWLASWLAGQLGWEPKGRHIPGPGRLEATFRGPAGEVAVEIRTEDDPDGSAARLTGVTLTTRGPDGAGSFRLERPSAGSDEVQVEVTCPTHCALPRRVLAPESSVSRRVAAALESSRDDPPFRRALPIVLWMLEA